MKTSELFTDEEVRSFRTPGGKTTLIGCGILDDYPRGVGNGPGVLHAGGWKPTRGREAMPMCYLRDRMTAAFEFTGKDLEKLEWGNFPGEASPLRGRSARHSFVFFFRPATQSASTRPTEY